MKIVHSGDDRGRRVLHVEADWSEVVVDYNDIVAAYTKVGVPGFRPGKVPKSVIEQRFQKEILEDLTRTLAERFGREAAREAGLEVWGPAEAEVLECARGRVFRAALRYHPLPKINLPDLGSLWSDAAAADPRDQISLRLLELVRFEVPDSLVREELALDGIDGAGPGSPDWKAASDRIRLMLVLKQIARQAGIVVVEKDVDDRIAEKAVEFGTTKKSLEQELKKGGGIQRIRDMLLAESTLDYLVERPGRTTDKGR